ncbi:outer membrane lipoprotein carrier protein LolA [Parafrigoribacterium mesophilum]|uniref:LolA family protein n=1 Tax=Parafrigoribacterium mesophilum TaxID=433646 RepID=UPI0031FD7009
MKNHRMPKTLSRWLPAVLVPALIAGVAVVAPFQASAAQKLPTKTPQQVLAMVAGNQVHAFSGTVKQSSELGLPQLPAGEKFQKSPADSVLDLPSVLELLGGSHTARVYVDGPTKARLQVLDRLAERDVIRNGSDLWLYSSEDNTSAHLTLPAKGARHGTETRSPGTQTPDSLTPAALGEKIVAALDASTRVTIGDDTTVAGRTAYNLVLTPRTTETLVRSVSVAVDSETGLPLGVQVRARGQEKPAFQLGFTQLSLTTPSANLFTFTPPPGSTMKEHTLPDMKGPAKAHHPKRSGEDAVSVKPTVLGTGWSAIVELPAGRIPKELMASPLVAQLTTPVAGGRMVHTSLVNVLVTKDGRVFAGAVPASRLLAAAQSR